MNLAEERIKEKIKTLNLKTNDKYLQIGGLILISAVLISAVLLGTGVAIRSLYDFLNLSYLPIIIGIFIVFCGGTVALYVFVQRRNVATHNQRVLAKLGPELHHLYFENNPNLLPDLNLKFQGIYPSQVFITGQCFQFQIGPEKIFWNIDQDVEIRTVTTNFQGRSQTTTYKVYFLKYCFRSSAEKLNGLKNIYIQAGKTPEKKGNFFQSESMVFNARFQVQGTDQVEIYKLFTPKVIDNFLNKEPGFLKTRRIDLTSGLAQVDWRGPEALKSWVPNPFDFSKIHWSKKRMEAEIYQKVKLDFDRYLEIQDLLEPLDLYS